MEQSKRWIPTGIMLLVVAAMMVHGPIAQFAHYHEFADNRALDSLPNAADVLSNIGFALVSIWGFWALRGKKNYRRSPRLGPVMRSSWVRWR